MNTCLLFLIISISNHETNTPEVRTGVPFSISSSLKFEILPFTTLRPLHDYAQKCPLSLQ